MPKFTPLEIGGVIFKTKKSLHKRRTDIIKNTMLNQKQEILLIDDLAYKVFKIENEQDLAFINDLYKCHPKYPIWILDEQNTPIEFYVGNYGPKGSAYFVKTIKQNWVFSAKKCIDGNPSHYAEVCTALRNSTLSQIFDFRKEHLAKNGKFISAVSGLEVPFDDVHVDHHNPQFITIVGEWLRSRNYEDTDKIKITGSGLHLNFENYDDEVDWFDFHNRSANLRITSKAENLSKKENYSVRVSSLACSSVSIE